MFVYIFKLKPAADRTTVPLIAAVLPPDQQGATEHLRAKQRVMEPD